MTELTRDKVYNILIIVFSIIILIILIILLFPKKSVILNNQEQQAKVELIIKERNIELYEDESKNIEVIIINSKPGIDVQYNSNNEECAFVDKDGIIYAKKFGVAIITIKYDDNEGNKVVETITLNVKKKLDKLGPTISYSFVNGKENEWNNKNVSIKIKATDNEELKSLKYTYNCNSNCKYTTIRSNETINFEYDGEYSVQIVATDKNNNETKKRIRFKIDKNKPTISYNLNSGTYNKNQTIIVNINDDVSDIKSFNVEVYKDNVLDVNRTKRNIKDLKYDVNLNSDATWKIVVSVEDNALNKNENSQKYVIAVNAYYEGPGGDKYSKTITFNGRTYKIYKQARYPNVKFWDDGNLADNGCAPTSLAIVLSGYKENITPIQTAKVMSMGTFDELEKAIKHYGMKTSGIEYYNSNDYNETRVAQLAKKVRAHLNKGKPLIALVAPATNPKCTPQGKYSWQNHFIAILGEKKDGTLIVGQPGKGGEGGTLENLIRCYMPGGRKGFLFIET